MDDTIDKTHQHLQFIEDFLIKIGHGDYNSKLPVGDEKDEQLAAIQVGINMLVEELKETTISRIFLDSIYNGISDILIVLSDKVEIQKTNQAVETTLLYTEAELLKQPLGKLIQKTDFDLVRNCIRNTYEQKKLNEAAFNFVTKDNKLIPVSCSFSPLYNVQGVSTGILLVAKNISTLINARNQLQEKNEELSLFVYKASHDLKSPVSSMMGIMALINESQDIDELKMYMKMISECTVRLDTIIADLLVLGRITYGELEYEQVDIKPMIDDVLKSIEFIDGYKDIALNIVIDDSVKSIITEKGLFQTILQNLIDNAIKYRRKGDEQSFINISVDSHEKGILIKIADNGIGIAEHQQANIFKMFYRATSASKGTGLGLYIVKTSVIKLGGNISFESTAGKGSSFKIYLPSQ